MTIDWSLLIGLISIALGTVSIAFALFFGLRGFRADIREQLRDMKNHLLEIKDKVLEVSKTVEKIWDLAVETFPRITAEKGKTVERNLKNLGKTKISARTKVDSTDYVIEFDSTYFEALGKIKEYEKPILKESP